MPTEALLAILGVAILANLALLASIPFRARRDARFGARASRDANAPSAVRRSARDGTLHDEDARGVAAIEAFVADIPADATGLARAPTPSEVLARRRALVTGPGSRTATDPIPRSTTRPDARAPSQSGATTAVPNRHPPVWALAGVADRATWDRTVQEESARAARFIRPVTVVIAELPRLDDVSVRLGRDAADRVVAETARLLVAEGRAVDQVAWLDDAVFGVLMPETEEARARDYVERVRAASDEWLRSAGLSVRLSLGWASPAEDRDIVAAAALAQQRMHEPDVPPVTGTPTAS